MIMPAPMQPIAQAARPHRHIGLEAAGHRFLPKAYPCRSGEH